MPGMRRWARPGARPSRRGACAASDTPAAVGLPVAAGVPLRAAGMDQAASPLAGGVQARAGVHHIVLEDYIAAVEAAQARRDRLTAQIEAMLPDWTLAPVVALRSQAEGREPRPRQRRWQEPSDRLLRRETPLAGRHRGFRPPSARTRDCAVPDSSAPCAA
jgi:hypothetical protein